MTNNANLTIGIGANTTDYENGLARAQKKSEAFAKSVRAIVQKEMQAAAAASEQSTKKIAGDFGKLEASMANLKGLAGGFVSGFVSVAAVKQAVDMADQMKTLEARIKNATKATGDFKTVNEQLFKISQQNGAAFEDSVSVFQSLARSSKDLGASNTQMLQLTDAVQKLGVIGGSSTEAMKNGLLQFSQAMAGGTVHAEEFNSILENMPEVANRIAQGLGMSVGHLRSMVADGKITSKEVFDSLLKQSAQINKDFEKMPVSLGQAGQAVQNSFGKFFLQLDKSVGLTGSLATGFKGVSTVVDDITAKIKSWSDVKIQTPKGQTTQGDLFQSMMAQIGKDPGKLLDPAGLLTSLMNSTGEIGKRAVGATASRPKDMYGPPVPPEAMAPGESKEAKKAREKREKEVAKQNENFKEYLKNLKQETIELGLQNKHLDNQHAVVKALYDAEQKKGAALTENEKKLVTQAALEKEKVEKAKEAAKKAAEQKKDYEKISAELVAHARGLDLVNAGQEGAAHWAEKRYELEQKIKEAGLTEDQAKQLRAQNEQNILKEQEAEHQKILKSLQDQRDEAELIFQGREKELPLIQKIREEEEKGVLTAERKQQLEQAFWDTKRAESLKAFNDMSEKEGDEINRTLLKLKGQEDYIPLLEKENQIKKMIGVSDEQKAEMLSALRQQHAIQLGLNGAMEQQKRTIDSIMKGGDGYVNQVKKLNEALGTGQINVKQYNDAMSQLAMNGKKASDFATDFAKTITGGLDKAITKGEKLGTVFKDMGKQLASLALQKVTPMLANGIDNILGRFSGGFGGLFQPKAGGTMAGIAGGADYYAVSNTNNLAQIAYNTGAIYDVLSSKFGTVPGRWGGGPVYAGQPYMVGERGQEMFVPSQNGSIVPNNYTPTYSDKANFKAAYADYMAEKYQQQGMWLQASLWRQNILGSGNAWRAWGSANPSGAFGVTPQIMDDAHDFQGYLDREPGFASSGYGQQQKRFLDWARGSSGGIGRNSYSFLQGAQSTGWGGSAGDMAQNPLFDGMQDFSIGGLSALKSRMSADAYFANPNRATAFNRPFGLGLSAKQLANPMRGMTELLNTDARYGFRPTLYSGMNDKLSFVGPWFQGGMFAGGNKGSALYGTTNEELMAAAMSRGGGKAPASWSAPMPAYMPDGITRDGFSSYGDNLKRAYGFGAIDRPEMPFWEKPMSQLEYRMFYGKEAAKAAYYRPTFDYGYQLQNQPGTWSDPGMPWGWWAAMPRYAQGGAFTAGRPMVVGERGKELVIPSTSGTVVPNHELNGFGKPELKVIVNNNAPGVDVEFEQDANGNIIATVSKMIKDNNRAMRNQLRKDYGSPRAAGR